MNSSRIIEKIRFHGWRLAIVAAMLAWTYHRYELIGDTTRGLVHIGLDLMVIGFIAYKIYSSRFRWRSPRKFIASKWDSENKLTSITLWIFPWIFVFAVVAGCIYKFDLDVEESLLLIGLVFVVMLLNGITVFFNSCLVEKENKE